MGTYKNTSEIRTADMGKPRKPGKPKHPCWEYVKPIQDPANPSKKRWQCNYCNKDYSGGAARIQVHLGLVIGQGIEPCQKFKKGHMSQVPENGMSSAAENAQVAGFPSGGLVFNQESLNIPPQTSLGGAIRSIESEMDCSAHTSDLSMGDSTILAATINYFSAVVDSQPPVDPSNIMPQQYNMSASTLNRELMVDIGGENPGPGVQSGLLRYSPDLPEEYHQADAMQVDRDTCRESGQRTGAAFPDLTCDAILVPELVGQEFNRVVNEIWDYITKENILHVGIYGMGGVGKTTIVKHLYNKVCANADFCNVLWVTVSKDCSIHELQNKIAKAINVPDLFKDADKVMRPTLLYKHLSKQKKSLIILDDLWQHLELKDVGIPVMKDGIQLVLTTRNRHVCEKMLCQKTIGVKPLSNEESWTLFVRTFGSDLSPSWEPTAKSIAEECKGVRMHDVIRDMALYIMNANSPCMVKSGLHLDDMPGEDEWMPNLQRVSLMKSRVKVVSSMSPNCPKLTTLLLSGCWGLGDFPDCFFEWLPGLKSKHIQHPTMIKSYALIIGFHGYDDQGPRLCPIDEEDYKFGKVNSMWGKKSIALGDIGQYSMGETFHLPRDVKTLAVEHYNGTWSDICRLEDLGELQIFDCREVSALLFLSQQGDHCPNLKVLQIRGCLKLKHLLVRYFKKLEKLYIYECEELESIIGGATDEEESLTSSLPPNAIPAATFPLQLPLLTSICVWECSKMKRVLTLELFMLLPNLQFIQVWYCKEMKEVIGGQELDHGATSSLFLSPITAASPRNQLSTRKLTLKLYCLEELESICSWTGLRDLIHVINIRRCPKLKRIEMLDNASPPPSLEEIVLEEEGDGNTEKLWWESLEWVHPEAKTALEPYVFVKSFGRKIPLQERRDHHHLQKKKEYGVCGPGQLVKDSGD
ncbi:hypothetical protein CRG98_015302 [Punica granatum]|uniref:BED-type domain-containing protein n=1 Tax=Punica granatum TaxID=22663 RepID=A0A2I0K6W5_PUNGR|nr:hypothetical protein CRG98_015302 [Punica granatum]